MRNWKKIDEQYKDLTTEYGAKYTGNNWVVNLWHPFAKKVELVIFDKEKNDEIFKTIEGQFISPNWTWKINEDVDGYFYQYKITQEDGSVNFALDPFAKSMAAFNWEGKNTNVGKAAFVKIEKNKNLFSLPKINEPQPIIYEAHVRDLTSLRNDVTVPGSFNAIQEMGLAKHLKEIGITHIQFLPIHNCYTLNEMDKKILLKGDGKGWDTNYNWGYDPHNYFSINGWYSTKPSNPYSRINEFSSLVKYFHKNNIKVILDVVYNHMFNNNILNNIVPGYYFRPKGRENPVDQPAFASERAMARRIIIDSLVHFVEAYDVDGFRFDLVTFTDKETLYMLAKKLRAIKPNLVLHGEAWDWTDLESTNSFNKASVDNEVDFAYFNDTTRNAIKGADDAHEFEDGLLAGANKFYGKYLSSIIGNIMEFKNAPQDMSKDRYDRFTNNTGVNLQYIACHDGHTLWDKINLTISGDKIKKFEIYRQALMMQQFTQGRTLYLGGTELLYTKPNDHSGQDGERYHKTDNTLDIFGLGQEYNENTYKTTDYSNGLRWNNYDDNKKFIGEFMAKINKFRLKTSFFNLYSTHEINNSIKFIKASKEELIYDFEININNQIIRVIHNISSNDYSPQCDGKILFDSKIHDKNSVTKIQPHSSVLISLNN